LLALLFARLLRWRCASGRPLDATSVPPIRSHESSQLQQRSRHDVASLTEALALQPTAFFNPCQVVAPYLRSKLKLPTVAAARSDSRAVVSPNELFRQTPPLHHLPISKSSFSFLSLSFLNSRRGQVALNDTTRRRHGCLPPFHHTSCPIAYQIQYRYTDFTNPAAQRPPTRREPEIITLSTWAPSSRAW